MISREVLDNGKVTSLTKCKHFGFVQRKQNASAMERGQQTNCQRTNLKPNPVEFAPAGHSKCLALVRFGPNIKLNKSDAPCDRIHVCIQAYQDSDVRISIYQNSVHGF